MSELNNLREKLDKAISNFKKKDKKVDILEYKAEYEQLLRITKHFSDLQHHIQKNDNQMAELLLLKEAYERKINYELGKMKNNIFEELLCYKGIKEKGDVDEVINRYSDIDEKLILEKYKILIENNLKVLDISIKNEEIFLKNVSEHNTYLEEDGKAFGLKLAGLDPTLYKYYSSSDDLITNTKLKHDKNDGNTSLGIANANYNNGEAKLDNAKDYDNSELHINQNLQEIKNGDAQKTYNGEDNHRQNVDNKIVADSSAKKESSFDSSENISEGRCTDLTEAIKKEDVKQFDNQAIAKTMHNISNTRQNNQAEEVDAKIGRIKDEIKNEEKTNQFNLETKHGAKEKIHILFRKLTLNKLEMTETILQKYENESKRKEDIEKAKVMSEYDVKILKEKERIKTLLLVLHKEFTKTEDVPEIKEVRLKIDKLLAKLAMAMIESKEKVVDYILSSVHAVLSQGSLEADIRFIEKMDRQLSAMEKFDTPRFFKISVEFEIAKKYVQDIIYLKKKALLSNFYNV
ncbi:hypothetical protein BDAP_000082 [Binucleata daphniae]